MADILTVAQTAGKVIDLILRKPAGEGGHLVNDRLQDAKSNIFFGFTAADQADNLRLGKDRAYGTDGYSGTHACQSKHFFQ